MRELRRGNGMSLAMVVVSLAVVVVAQDVRSSLPPPAANVVVPQRRVFSSVAGGPIRITGVTVGAVIVEQVATTTLDISLENPGPARTEAELVVPVPAGVAVRTFAFEGAAAEPTAQVLPAGQAGQLYNAIVAKARDPALLEFVGAQVIRSSVFPLEAHGKQKVRLTYEQVLSRDGRRIDYELPRTAALDYDIPWDIAVKITSPTPIATVYSPTHALETVRGARGTVSVRTTAESRCVPGSFRLSYLLADEGVTATLLAYPDPDSADAGYFLLLAGLPPAGADTPRTTQPRELTLVIDHSGSMGGGKLDQARAAALQVLEGLAEGESFNIIAYHDSVTTLFAQPVRKAAPSLRGARDFLQRLNPGGGTNLHAALVEALRPPPLAETLPLVLFLTDGLPTTGVTAEVEIRRVATEQNPHQRRVFTFGVGADVNTPLLSSIALETRAQATFILPGEDVEVKVADVFKKLKGPMLTDVALRADTDGALAAPRVTELLPARLPDLFEDDQLVLLGRYHGTAPLAFTLRGTYLGQPREFRLRFDLDSASTRNAFVPRLWASRQIAALIDDIRQMGADPRQAAASSADPRLKELTDEIVRLSTEFGILTEYTAFLAREGTDLAKRDVVRAEALRNFQNRAVATRSGLGAVNQAMNVNAQMQQRVLNNDNRYYDENMNRVAITEVQQVNDLAFFRRGTRWVDSRLATVAEQTPDRVVEWGSPAFAELVARLAHDNRSGSLALAGEILLRVGDQRVLVRGPGAGQ